MKQLHDTIHVRTRGRGLVEITAQAVDGVARSGVRDGACNLLVQHTSASLVVQENADPSARADLERFFDRLVPDGDPLYRHVAEGPDDMPAHVRAALTLTSLLVPVHQGRLQLGTWQGIWLFEHRLSPHSRRVALHVFGS